jgi:hypothetical protein
MRSRKDILLEEASYIISNDDIVSNQRLIIEVLLDIRDLLIPKGVKSK